MGKDEIKRRLEAARILRNISQAELDRLGHEEGLGKYELGRLERGDLAMTGVRRRALAGILHVPEEWFTAEAVDDLIRPASGDQLEAINAKLDRLLAIIDRPALEALLNDPATDQALEDLRARTAPPQPARRANRRSA